MENKKIRISLPFTISEVLDQDIEDFKIKKNKLCNLIFERYKDDYLDLFKGFKSKHNKIVQFNLNKKNSFVYYDILNRYAIQNESEFFRNLIFMHMNKPKYERERIVFADKFHRIEAAIKSNKQLTILSNGKSNLIEPYFIKKSNKENKNYLFCYSYKHNKCINYKVSHIEIKAIETEPWQNFDASYVKSIKENFDPFLSHGSFVKVRLTKQGYEQYKYAIVNQPKLISKEGDIYIFEASTLKAQIYFPQFLDQVEIIEPTDLRIWFQKRVENLAKLYSISY